MNAAAAPAAASHSRALWVVLALAAMLRLAHLAAAVRNPMTYNPGPDEDFYLQFATRVAEDGWRVPVEFLFMDPLYGYAVGALFALTGGGVFALYAAQMIIDLVTVVLLYRCGVEVDRPRAGLIAAAAFALCATAIMFAATALKATGVACFVALWTWLALRAVSGKGGWLWLGLLAGLAVGLRSNLILVGLAAIVVLPWLAWGQDAEPARVRARARASLALAAGLVAGLLPWSALHASHALGASPLPYNGGVVLHHLYNASNPRAISVYPAFVTHRHPMEIWRGYRREAERIAGRAMTPGEISAIWRREALSYIADHPRQTLANMARKLREFVAYPEVPNNRAFQQEREHSPVLKALPAPFPWLIALGGVGLLLWARDDRRAWAALVPMGVCVVTVMVFFAEDRFRFHAVPTLSLGAGLLLDRIGGWWEARRWQAMLGAAAGSAFIAILSASFARDLPEPRIETSRAAWGYLRMGDETRAVELAQAALAARPGDASLHELLGLVAARRGDHRAAAGAFGRAAHARPDRPAPFFHLATSLAAMGELPPAVAAARRAAELAPEPAHLGLLADLLARAGHTAEAVAVLDALLRLPGPHREATREKREALCARIACPALSPTEDTHP